MEYVPDLDPLQRRSLKLWARRCVLAKFVSFLDSHWSEEYGDEETRIFRESAHQHPLETCSPGWDPEVRLELYAEHGKQSIFLYSCKFTTLTPAFE
jgi:hypothetical protein